MKLLIVIYLLLNFHVNSLFSFEIRRGPNRPPSRVTGSKNSPGGINIWRLLALVGYKVALAKRVLSGLAIV